jgi:hypothetical protein
LRANVYEPGWILGSHSLDYLIEVD